MGERESPRAFGYTPLEGHAFEREGVEEETSLFSSAVVEQDRFQCFIGLVILLNVVVLWGETDEPDWIVWQVCDNLFLIVFLVEIVLRIVRHKIAFFFGKDRWWALFDSAMILLGLADLWVVPLWLELRGRDREMESVESHLEFFRLTRLLRLVRIFRMFDELMAFANALSAMCGFFIWIVVLSFANMLVFSIVLTHMLGHGEGLGDLAELRAEHGEALASVMEYFGDVPDSLFTLFQLITMDNWDDIGYPLVELNTWWRIFFVGFIASSSWVMLSVLTAVASDSMIAATSERKVEQMHNQEERTERFLDFLRNCFLEADLDGNGMLDKEEFETMFRNDLVLKRMSDLGVTLSEEELNKTWKMLITTEEEVVTTEEFVAGLRSLQEGLATKHIVNVDYALKRVIARVENQMGKLENSTHLLLVQNEEILERLRKNEESQHQQQGVLWAWQQWAARGAFNAYLQQETPLLFEAPSPRIPAHTNSANAEGEAYTSHVSFNDASPPVRTSA